MQTGLDGRVVVITGAASGIGRAAALAFAAEGASVGLVDLDRDGLEAVAADAEALGVQTTAVQADLSTAAGVRMGLEGVLRSHDQRVDVLVNNVGSCRARDFDDLSDEDWLATFELNFMSYVRATRLVLPAMRAAGSGCVLNNASDLARQPEPGPADYQVSKVAVVSMTKSLALSEGPAIRVNAVAPGPVWTPLWSRPGGFADTLAEVHGKPPREAVDHELSLRQLPAGRLGTPEEVANVFVFLASDAASFVTGSVWGVDGGSIRGLL
jgi:NAD(P)-dependent dehydrogenase (short-subunit alcohol dehydrogenase family)